MTPQYFYTRASSFCLMDSKLKQRVHIKFCVKLSKSTTKTLEMLHETFGQRFLSGIHVLRPVEYQLKMKNVQGYQLSAEQQKMLKNHTAAKFVPLLLTSN
jgi:hypothetical protein